jgi:hypothetical protein
MNRPLSVNERLEEQKDFWRAMGRNWPQAWVDRVIHAEELVVSKREAQQETYSRWCEAAEPYRHLIGTEQWDESIANDPNAVEAWLRYEEATNRVLNAYKWLKRTGKPERLSRRRITAAARRDVMARWEANGRICCICGKPVTAGAQVHVDHKKPVCVGGDSSVDNLDVAHAVCNVSEYSDPFTIAYAQPEHKPRPP